MEIYPHPELMHFVGPCITLFGSARFTESHREQATGQIGLRYVHRRPRRVFLARRVFLKEVF